MAPNFELKCNLIDIKNKTIFPALITVNEGKIFSILPINEQLDNFILPGFIDAHIHIESSMLVPTAFSQAASVFGTVATVSDPHEIANVCGIAGVKFMMENAKKAAIKIHFGAPSCVPATTFEHSGAQIDAHEIDQLLKEETIYYLSEMMNFPGVIYKDESVLQKIEATKKVGKPIDGHAPGLTGNDLKNYVQAGISTDHECTQLAEALEKIDLGMKILIREGSAAKNFDALVPLFNTHPYKLMFCSDDKHPDELIEGHINVLVKKAIALGYNLFDVLYAACIAPIEHYKIPVGCLNINDPADFIIVNNCTDFEVLATYINGEKVAENGYSLERNFETELINNFDKIPVNASQFTIPIDASENAEVNINAITAVDGQLITHKNQFVLKVKNQSLHSSIDQDILKIAVINRYGTQQMSVGFINNFGLKKGAIASTVAHDSHNIVVVGADDVSMANAVNEIIKVKGGISVADTDEVTVMPLPVAGLMSDLSAKETAEAYKKIDALAKKLGTTLTAPFMTLSFMSLPVIPSLKITDKGLFDVDLFNFTSIIQSK